MSVAHQLVDVLVSGLIAGLSSFVIGALAPQLGVTIGVILASMYYFFRIRGAHSAARSTMRRSMTSTTVICRSDLSSVPEVLRTAGFLAHP